MYKTIDEIRLQAGMSKGEFADFIGIGRRAYEKRSNTQPRWWADEIIKVASLNNGEILFEYEGKQYRISIK